MAQPAWSALLLLDRLVLHQVGAGVAAAGEQVLEAVRAVLRDLIQANHTLPVIRNSQSRQLD